jgi:hypothetical protein
MNPSYVQTASQTTNPQNGYTHTNFTNLSSQQISPGLIEGFFQSNNPAEPMPFGMEDLKVRDKPIMKQISEDNNVSNLPKAEGMPSYFNRNTSTRLHRFRTQSMKAWGVPLGLTELRATDMMY